MSSDASKYETFLRRTRKRVRRPANDHDKAQIGAGQTALLDRIDELKALQKRVKNAINSRCEILGTEERELRKLSKAKEKDVFCDALVLIDSRQGGVILVRDAETGDVLAGPTPLSASQREVFASTKSQPGLFGDPVAVNEELAKKLNLMEYLADDPPITIEQRVANALNAGDLPDDLKEAILSLDEDDDPAPKDKTPKEPKAKKGKGKKAKGEAFTNPQPAAPPAPAATPAPTAPSAPAPTDDEPGPAAIEPDREELPKRPPRARAPLSDTPPEDDEPSAGDVADAEGMAGDSGETHAPETSEEPSEPAADADDSDEIPDFGSDAADVEPAAEDAGEPTDESPRAREYDTGDESEAAMEAHDAAIDDEIAHTDDVAPDSSDAPGEPLDMDPSEQPEPTDVPPDAEITTDAIPEMDDAPESPAEPASEPADASPEVAPTDTPAAEPAPVTATEEPVAKAETPAPKKRGGTKKKADAEPPPAAEPVATTPPAEPVAPAETTPAEPPAAAPEAPALSLANHFGLKSEKMAIDAMAAFKSMAKREVFFSSNLAADVETAAKTKFSASMRASIVPMFAHLAAEKEITRRKLANGDFAYYDAPTTPKSPKDLTTDKVEAAIVAYLK